MKTIFQTGDQKTHTFVVTENDVAHFDQQAVHDVCATFTLAKEVEWSSRLFVLEMLDLGEEGIGTHLNIEHVSPALKGQEVVIKATFEDIREKEIICNFEASVEERVVARGSTGQRILPKEKLALIFERISK